MRNVKQKYKIKHNRFKNVNENAIVLYIIYIEMILCSERERERVEENESFKIKSIQNKIISFVCSQMAEIIL